MSKSIKIKLEFSKTYLLINEKDRLLEDGKLWTIRPVFKEERDKEERDRNACELLLRMKDQGEDERNVIL